MATDIDLLESAQWECAATPPDEATSPDGPESLPLRWIAAPVPGTAAGALRDAGCPERSSAELDGEDWWFRCRFDSPSGQGDQPGRGRRAGPDAWLLAWA